MELSGQLHAPAALAQGKSPGTPYIGGYEGPRAGLDAVAKRKLASLPLPGTEPRSSNPQPSLYIDWATPTPKEFV